MIKNKEQKLTDFNLFLMSCFLPAVNFQFFKEKEHSFNKEQIFPSFVANIAFANLFIQQTDDSLVAMLTDKCLLC